MGVTVRLHQAEEQRGSSFRRTMASKSNHQFRIFMALVVFSLQDVSGLKCEVGLNNETQVLECEGSWDKMKMMMADKLGSQWETVQQNITGMTGIIETLS